MVERKKNSSGGGGLGAFLGLAAGALIGAGITYVASKMIAKEEIKSGPKPLKNSEPSTPE